MPSKILINAVDSEECRIAKLTDNRLSEFNIETASHEITMGNIYKGIVSRVEPSLQAVFVDYGAPKNGFLQKSDIHPDYFIDDPSGNQTLNKIMKRGQELIVQVTNDPAGKKGAMLTTYISLPGRYTILMPGSKTRGISRKITDEKERNRLKEIIGSLNIPEDYGVIVRTAGNHATKTVIGKDIRYLMRLWKSIKKAAMQEKGPALLHRERSLAIRAVRDSFTPDVKEILIDDEGVFNEVRKFIRMIAPQQQRIVKLYTGDRPIFAQYNIEEQIASVFDSRVALASGGSIVIEQTEALVSIDVNSGKATQKKSMEATALSTNMEAAAEIARQLRLRDMGGLIVIDFIDMRDSRNKKKVEQELKKHLKDDRARTKVGRISVFGLLEMSRQRIRPSVQSINSVVCSHCKGKGVIQSVESLSLAFMRKLRIETLKEGIRRVECSLPPDVALYVLNHKKPDLLELEKRRNIEVSVNIDQTLLPDESRITVVRE